jgi:hypothetical protein
MRLLKPLLLGLAGLFIVIFLISSLLPNHVMTSKWVRVHASKDSILDEVRNLQGWQEWNGLLMGATDVHVSDSTMSWISSGSDKRNTVTIKGSTSMGLSTEISLHEGNPFSSGFSIEKRDPSMDSVQVVWFIVEELKWYPWEKFYGIMAADVKGPLMQQSLNRLKIKLQSGQKN